MGFLTYTEPIVLRILSMLPPSVKSVTQSADQTNNGRKNTAVPASSVFHTGTVVRAGVGNYDYEVILPHRKIVATAMIPIGNGLSGVSAASLIPEGTVVLVMQSSNDAKEGVIIGAISPKASGPFAEAAITKDNPGRSAYWDQESYAGIGSESPYKIYDADKKYITKMHANGSRPMDIMPGSHVYVNEHGVGMGITSAAAALKAGPQASVRVSLIDDNVKITSGHYQHYNPSGLVHVFNDGGLITAETTVNMYQAEHAGMKKIGPAIIKKLKDFSSVVAKHRTTSAEPVKKEGKMVGKARLSSFVGYLGDIVNLFVYNPDPNVGEPETAEDKSKHQGLAHIHVDSSGRLMARSAAGVAIERVDRIVVPKRVKQPWDPKGNKMEDADPVERKPFKWSKEHPYGRNLELRDGQAWRYRGAYWRLLSQSDKAQSVGAGGAGGGGGSDFYIPDENELKCPDDKYDETGKSEEKFKDNDNRRSGMYFEDDGSVIIRDAWGSEILMRGGSIILNAAAQIEVRSGKSTVVVAGHDAIVKARQSVDLSASNNDVRIKGQENVQIVSGNGLLIESKSAAARAWNEEPGEKAAGGGITLSAPESGVFAHGKILHLSGSSRVKLETFDDEDKNAGSIWMSANTIRSVAKKNLTTQCGGSALSLSNNSAILAGRTGGVATESRAFITKGSQMLGAPWVGVDTNVYSSVEPKLDELSSFFEEPKWLSPFDGDGKKNAKFTWRTSEEYGTMSAVESKGSMFAVYQPFWSFAKSAGGLETLDVSPEAWGEEKPVVGSDELPWPGKAAMKQGYVKLDGENNVDKDGITKPGKLREESGKLQPTSMTEYEVAPHK